VTAPTIVVDDSAVDPHADLWFAEPPGFLPLPLDALLPEPGSRAADALRAAAAPFLDSAPDDTVRIRFVAHVAAGQQLLAALREAGTVHCALGLHRDDAGDVDDGLPLVSWFTVSWRATAVAPRAATAARAVAPASGFDRVEYRELPCGPASLGEAILTPPAGTALPQQPLLQLRAHLPHPDGKRLAVLALSTTALARREQYRAILRRIVETVCFRNPLEAAPSEGVGTPP
jgi:hypothetical protein